MQERLRQLELVGCGAMAEVYRGALHGEHGTSRPVAIKRLRPELRADPAAVDLFVNEAKIAVRMQHPNVVHALELARDDHGYALVCEWLDCASLQQLRDQGTKLPAYAVVHVGRCLCNALEYLHGLSRDDGAPLGLVHRDVTPANVFLTQGGEVKLADFGVAWCKDDGNDTIAGTPEFAAPEQKRGNDIDARADIYGLGATMRAIANDLPNDLATIVERACAEDRNARYTDARELAAELEKVNTKLGSTTARHRIADLMADCRTEDPTITAPRLDGAVHSILGGALSKTKEVTQPDAVVPQRPQTWRLVLTGLLVVAVLGLGFAYQWTADQVPSHDDHVVDTVTPTPEPEEPEPEPLPEPEPVATTPTEPTPPPRKPPAAVAKGVVSLNAIPWAKVKIDGKDMGNTPVKAISLTAGRHTVTLFNPAQKLRKEVTIEVEGKRAQTFLVNLRRGTVEKRKQP